VASLDWLYVKRFSPETRHQFLLIFEFRIAVPVGFANDFGRSNLEWWMYNAIVALLQDEVFLVQLLQNVNTSFDRPHEPLSHHIAMAAADSSEWMIRSGSRAVTYRLGTSIFCFIPTR
jgi:hypothetical protein